MADIDRKYVPVVQTDDFKEWIGDLKEKVPDLDLTAVPVRVLLYFYLYYREIYGADRGINTDFRRLIDRGYMDIYEGKHITMTSYLSRLKDYVALLRDSLESITAINTIDVTDSILDRIPILQRLNTVYLLDGIDEIFFPSITHSALIESADTEEIQLENWPEDIDTIRVIVDDAFD